MNKNLYRFTFADNIIVELDRFAKTHRYDDRHVFKDFWVKWLEEPDIKSMITEEIQRLNSTGYEGDILDKLFKSARYYYRNKSDELKEPVQRKEYVGFSKTFLVSMDMHIHNTMQAVNNKASPKEAFIRFCNDSKENIIKEIKTNKTCNDMTSEELTDKLKKTYKNRFYKLSIKK